MRSVSLVVQNEAKMCNGGYLANWTLINSTSMKNSILSTNEDKGNALYNQTLETRIHPSRMCTDSRFTVLGEGGGEVCLLHADTRSMQIPSRQTPATCRPSIQTLPLPRSLGRQMPVKTLPSLLRYAMRLVIKPILINCIAKINNYIAGPICRTSHCYDLWRGRGLQGTTRPDGEELQSTGQRAQ